MSDYGQRGYGSGSEGHGWASGGSHSGRQGNYDDFSDLRGPSGDAGATARVPSPHDEPLTSGRAQVHGEDAAAAGAARGSARVGARRNGLSEAEAAELQKNRKKRKRRRKFIALGCVAMMFLGVATIAAAIFFQSVPLPDEFDDSLVQSSTVKYSNGEDMAKIGGQFSNRQNVKVIPDGQKAGEKEVPEDVKYALLATEDRGFYRHEGVDFRGVVRAFWNNVTGGETQGASTLTQQYVGQALDMRKDKSYMRKAKEAVIAMKMNDAYEKYEIIQYYLNFVYMGRGAYGIGTAAKAWFDKPVHKLTAAEAALIFIQVKNPTGEYDPRDDKGDQGKIEGRWAYALKGMKEEKWMSPDAYQKAIDKGVPKTEPIDVTAGNDGLDKDTGFVSHGQLLYEAEEKANLTEDQLQNGGYEITTTINPKLQDAAVAAASRKEGGYMKDMDKKTRAGLVSIDPSNGEVVAYFGGSSNGTDTDKAGQLHPPGSAFKEFTMLAALKDGRHIDSIWDGSTPRTFEERGDDRPVTNANEEDDFPRISMQDAIRKSLNTPIYAMTKEIGADAVVKTANDMGIRKMTSKNGETLELGSKEWQKKISDDDPRAPFDYEVGFGQYPVSITDMASANATLAAQGKYTEPHFIKEIKDSEGDVVYNADDQLGGKLKQNEQALNKDQAADATHVASTIMPTDMGEGNNKLASYGQPLAGKSGTWERECGEGCDENSHIWYTGFAPQLAAAVWIGDEEDENGTVNDPSGNPAFGAGPSGSVWKAYMEKALEVDGYNQLKELPAKVGTGDKNKGEKPFQNPDDKEEKDGKCEDPTDTKDPDCPGKPDDCKPNDPRPECGGGGENPGTGECGMFDPGEWPDCNDDGIPCPDDPNDPACEQGGGGGGGTSPTPGGDCNPQEDPQCPRNNENNGGGGYRLLGTPMYATRPEDQARNATADSGRSQTSVSSP